MDKERAGILEFPVRSDCIQELLGSRAVALRGRILFLSLLQYVFTRRKTYNILREFM